MKHYISNLLLLTAITINSGRVTNELDVELCRQLDQYGNVVVTECINSLADDEIQEIMLDDILLY